MVTKEFSLERKAEMSGDKVIVRSKSSAVDEQTIGEFREEYLKKETAINGMKDELNNLNKNLSKTNEDLKGEDLTLLRKMQKKVTKLMIKEQIEERIKYTENTLKQKKKEIAGIKSVYDELTAKEMENRKDGTKKD